MSHITSEGSVAIGYFNINDIAVIGDRSIAEGT